MGIHLHVSFYHVHFYHCVCCRCWNLCFSIKIKKADSFSSMLFICSLFQPYKYYLHVMGFWPLLVETKSITHELLNLQSFKIPDSFWHRKEQWKLVTVHSLGLFLSLHFFNFPFSSPSIFFSPFVHVLCVPKGNSDPLHKPSHSWSPVEIMTSFHEPVKFTRLVNLESAESRCSRLEGGRQGTKGHFCRMSYTWFIYQVATCLTLTIPARLRGQPGLSLIYPDHRANVLNKISAWVSHYSSGFYMTYRGVMVYFAWVTKLI